MDKVLYFILFLLSTGHGYASPIYITNSEMSANVVNAPVDMPVKLSSTSHIIDSIDKLPVQADADPSLSSVLEKTLSTSNEMDSMEFERDKLKLETVTDIASALQENLNKITKIGELNSNDEAKLEEVLAAYAGEVEEHLDGTAVEAYRIQEEKSDGKGENSQENKKEGILMQPRSKDPVLQIVVGCLTFLLVVGAGIACYFLVWKKRANDGTTKPLGKAKNLLRTKKAGASYV